MIERMKAAWAVLTAKGYIVMVDRGGTYDYTHDANIKFLKIAHKLLDMGLESMKVKEKK